MDVETTDSPEDVDVERLHQTGCKMRKVLGIECKTAHPVSYSTDNSNVVRCGLDLTAKNMYIE